ncbi:MAG: MMPL family transporter, partial [Deltaproteobacteria bacterium]|nr:MMPL family transporter [Deltaproteobacteria bacterium]
MSPMHRVFAGYVRFLRRSDWLVVIASILLMAALFLVVRRLHLRSDFKEMLPEQYRSVQELSRIEQRVRATASLLLLVGGNDWPAMRRFIDDFTVSARRDLADIINRVDANAGAARTFFEKNKYLYVDLDDLREIRRRLQHHIDKEKLKAAGLYTELEPEPFDLSDIEDTYRTKLGAAQNHRDGYFTNEAATLAVVVLKPNVGATDVKSAEALMGRVRTVVERLRPATYHPSIKYGFGGRYPKVITEFQTVTGDILRTTVLCLSFVSLIILAYFHRLRIGFLMMVNITLGTLAALAVAYCGIGYLTTQTAFLGSIIVGNGINASIIFMARYIEERRERGHAPDVALAIALGHTWAPTLIAACTASASFGALGLTQMRGFSHFGLIGGIGMLLCWLATYCALPAWLHLSERVWRMRVGASRHQSFALFMAPFARWLTRRARPICAWSAVLTVGAIAIGTWYLPRSLEYDFNKLRFKPTQPKDTWEDWARSRADEIFGQSASPSVILAERHDQVEPICAVIDVHGKRLVGEDGQAIYDSCKSLASYVPKDQPEKIEELRRIRELLSG